MSNQPFGQAPAFGSPPPSPVDVPPVDETPATSNRTRTLVLAGAAGVVALGVLGGAVVLTGTADPGDESVVAAPPASTVPVEPSAAPTAVPTPLPTAVVRSRNVFVPLVEEGGAEAEASAAAAATAGSGSAPTASTSTARTGSGTATGSGTGSGTGTGSTTGSGSGSGFSSGGSGSGVPVIVYDPVVQDLLDSAIKEIARLEAEITELEAELRDASDDSDLQEEITDLKEQRDKLSETVDDLEDQRDARDAEDAKRLLVLFKEATPEELVVTVAGEDIEIAVGDSEVVGQSDAEPPVPLELTYLSLDEEADPDLVTFTYGSGVSKVQVGATVGFPR